MFDLLDFYWIDILKSISGQLDYCSAFAVFGSLFGFGVADE